MWTTKTKQKLDWKAPPPSETSSEAYELLVADGFYLDIGGFKLTIQPEDAPTNWDHVSKQRLAWPQTITTTTQLLDIGDGFNLNVGDGFVLEAGSSERNPIDWTTQTKTGR